MSLFIHFWTWFQSFYEIMSYVLSSFKSYTRILISSFILTHITNSNRAENIAHSSSSVSALSTMLLNCSRYSSLSSYTNSSIHTMSLQARLHACFSDYPYDTSQLPLPPSTNTLATNLSRSLELSYDYSIHYLIDFQNSCITLFGQLSHWWRDVYRE